MQHHLRECTIGASLLAGAPVLIRADDSAAFGDTTSSGVWILPAR